MLGNSFFQKYKRIEISQRQSLKYRYKDTHPCEKKFKIFD